jgi:hypothetical protein
MPETPPATNPAERAIIATLSILKVVKRHTIFDVFAPSGQYLGQVRERVGGYQCYRLPSSDPTDWLYAYGDFAPSDPKHALALMALLKEAGASSAPHPAPASLQTTPA